MLSNLLINATRLFKERYISVFMEYIYYKGNNIELEKESKKQSNIFIVTFCNTKSYHETMLKICIDRIRLFHPDADIVILNDSHSYEIKTVYDKCVRIEKTKYALCGEINAYVWACEHKNEYTNYIFIHDSVFLIKRIIFNIGTLHFRPLWFVSRFKSDDTFGVDTDKIIDKIIMNAHDVQNDIIKIRNEQGHVIFGSMAMFDNSFLEYLSKSTNFLDVANMFHTRKLRSFFERVLYIFISGFYDMNNFENYFVFGDILGQQNAFYFSSPLYSTCSNNPYALKIWQGR